MIKSNLYKFSKGLAPYWLKNYVLFIQERTVFLKKKTLDSYNLITFYLVDYFKYKKFYSISEGYNKSHKNMVSMIIKSAHTIEKAFSLPETRLGFGIYKVDKLLKLLDKYKSLNYPLSDKSILIAISILKFYLLYHIERSYPLSMDLIQRIEKWTNGDFNFGGIIDFTKKEIDEKIKGDFKDMSKCRWSLREYSKTEIDQKDIFEAVEIAKKTPSVCNRQAWKSYFVKDNQLKQQILELQNGNAGFGISAPVIVIITCNLRAFIGANERNQVYIEGGLFSMSLIYALHYKSIGTCPLNWCVSQKVNKKLKFLVGIPEEETVILLLSLGYYPEKFKVAQSERYDTSDFFVIK